MRPAPTDDYESSAQPLRQSSETRPLPVVLSFDVEEHDQIEAAVGLEIAPSLKSEYHVRMQRSTEWILEQLAINRLQATFFVVGQIAERNPTLVRRIHDAGHEIASHSWNHQRIHRLSPQSFRDDLRRSKEALEQATGFPIVGYRAPTFSIVWQTAWALDILAESGFLYDSSIYPIRHDRYGVHDAPRMPFLAHGDQRDIIELPPATVSLGGVNFPVGGGGYFRLLPFSVLNLALKWSRRDHDASATVLYFHPWEFDIHQPRLPLTPLKRFRTYVGIRHTQGRLKRLIQQFQFTRAIDLARSLTSRRASLPRYRLGHGGLPTRNACE